MAIKHFVDSGLGPKMPARILTVDKTRRRIGAALKDGGHIFIAVYTVPATFQWPVEGDVWMVRQDAGLWKLDEPIDLYAQHDGQGMSIEDLPDGAIRVTPTPTDTGSGFFINGEQALTTSDLGSGTSSRFTTTFGGTGQVSIAHDRDTWYPIVEVRYVSSGQNLLHSNWPTDADHVTIDLGTESYPVDSLRAIII